jgi:HEAT repeat protein
MLGSDAVPSLTRALEDEDWRVRQGAAQALGWIGPQAWDAIPALIDALSDERKEVRVAAGLALTTITDRDFGYNRTAWQRWWEKQ